MHPPGGYPARLWNSLRSKLRLIGAQTPSPAFGTHLFAKSDPGTSFG